MLGISVYFKDYNPEYIKEAAQLGVKYIFTSLQIPEEDYSNLGSILPDFFELCKKYHIQLIPDVSSATFDRLGIKSRNYNELKRMGFKSIRLDYGADDFQLVKQLQKDFHLLLNASVINDDYLFKAKAEGINLNKISLTYNFYPETNTGLSWSWFKNRNLELKSQGFTTQAFVCGDILKRFPMYEGLPTIEEDRGKDPFVAAVQMIHEAKVDDIFIGDSQASLRVLKNIIDYQNNKIMYLKCYLEPDFKYLSGKKLRVRADQPEEIVRLLVSRTSGVPIYRNLNRTAGSIVMQNKLAKRYSGEIYLIKKDLPVSARSNVIGFISPEYLELLNYIDSTTTIILDSI